MTEPFSYNVTAAHITQTPGVCGGKPCIAGRRIRVRDIYEWHEILGMSADEIASAYDLSLAQVYAALTYAFETISDIQADLQQEKDIVAEAVKRHPSKLQLRHSDE
jgi:uncharacterized protein (DUF433 family)